MKSKLIILLLAVCLCSSVAYSVESVNTTNVVISTNNFDQTSDGIYTNYYIDDFWMTADYSDAREHSYFVTKMLKFLGVGKWSGFTIPDFLATISKNIGMQCASFDNKKNKEIEESVKRLHENLGVKYNVYLGSDKPLPKHLRYKVRQMIDEDIAVNPTHFSLFVVCVILCLIFSRYRKKPTLIVYFVCIIIGFILLSGWFGWSPYNSRRQLPLFVLSAPFIAVILEKLTKRPLILEAVCILLLVFSYPWVVHNSIRQLIGKTTVFNMPRNDQYFRKFENLRLPYETVSIFIKEQKYKKVGIYCKRNATEYPLLALIKQKCPDIEIEHIGVENVSAKYAPKEPFIPKIIISLPYENMSFWFGNLYWEKIWAYGGVGVFVKTDNVSEQVKSLKLKVESEKSELNTQYSTTCPETEGARGRNFQSQSEKPEDLKPLTLNLEPAQANSASGAVESLKLKAKSKKKQDLKPLTLNLKPAKRPARSVTHQIVGERVYGKLKTDVEDNDLTITNNAAININIDPLTHRPADLTAAIWQIFNDLDTQLLKNGRFLNGMDDWNYWQYGVANTNKIIVENNVLRIENPFKKLIGVQQSVNVVSGTVYKLSGVARSVATTQSDIIFGGRIAFFLPPQKEKQLVWTSEYDQWSQKELVFTNEVTGEAKILVHLGYGNVGTTGEFTNIRLEKF